MTDVMYSIKVSVEKSVGDGEIYFYHYPYFTDDILSPFIIDHLSKNEKYNTSCRGSYYVTINLTEEEALYFYLKEKGFAITKSTRIRNKIIC